MDVGLPLPRSPAESTERGALCLMGLYRGHYVLRLPKTRYVRRTGGLQWLPLPESDGESMLW